MEESALGLVPLGVNPIGDLVPIQVNSDGRAVAVLHESEREKIRTIVREELAAALKEKTKGTSV